jgi:hypothetical protein
MNMKNLYIGYALLVIAALPSNICGQAADTINAFSSFELPDVHYRFLTLKGGVNGGGDKIRGTVLADAQKTFDFRTSAGGNYYNYLNTRRKQSTNSLGASAGFSLDQNTSDEQTRDLDMSTVFSGYHQIRWYRGEKFKELSLLHRSGLSQGTIKVDERTTKIFDVDLDVRPYIMMGHGRLEPISDVNLALFLVNDLDFDGLLTREVSDSELSLIAEQMARARYQRIFDSRERRKYELVKIDSMVQALDLVNAYDINYFTILADNWNYAFRPGRSRGTTFSFGISPLLYFDHTQNKVKMDGQTVQDIDVNERLFGIYGILQYQSETPMTLSRQRSFGGEFTIGYDDYRRTIPDFTPQHFGFPGATISAFYGLSFYPNSRTIWTNYIDGIFRGIYEDEDFGYAAQLRLYSSLTYFLSPRVQVTGNFNVSWNDFHQYSTAPFTLSIPIFPIGEFFYTEYPYIRYTTREIDVNLNLGVTYHLF